MSSVSRANPLFELPQYQLLRRAISERVAPLVLVVGSGLSVPAGLPDWKGLRNDVQLRLDNLKASLEYSGAEYDAYSFKDARKTEDYWVFFQLAKKLLGPATFNEIIREQLDPADLAVPPSYSKLMQLRPKGLVTLNLDRISSMALAEANPGLPINTIHGRDLSSKWYLMKEEAPFLVHLHGHVIDSSTWVLDQDELSLLTRSEAHSLFLSTLYMDNTVVFVGVSADDIALSGALLKLRKAGLEPHRLFWLTNRSDSKTTSWASENHVQLIQYRVDSPSDHLKQIAAVVENISAHKSLDEDLAPVVLPIALFDSPSKGLPPDELSALAPDEVRKALSDMLTEALTGLSGDALYDKFLAFAEEYDFPIRTRAFYRHRTKANQFFEYNLQFPELGRGNFGVVYGAQSRSGRPVAVKVMHDNILSTREMLGGFRRGSRSMKILTDSNVRGVAKLISAHEMPPTIVMELIPGNSLEELFSEIGAAHWSTKARIVADISNIVDQCHKLPEMVLHRDIKPSNVIIDGYDYIEKTYENLIVLDFDMSWHKGSSEKDVVFESRDDFGYLSPEQTDPSQAGNTRSAKVDSYGLGMTIFALFAGRHPIPNMPMASTWAQSIRQAASVGYNGRWQCLPNRVARAIDDATKVNQAERLEFSSLAHRLHRVSEVANTSGPVTLDVFCEEILARVAGRGWAYEWDDVGDIGSVSFPAGFILRIRVDGTLGNIELNLTFNDPGGSAYKQRDDMLRACKSALDAGLLPLEARIQNATVRSGYFSYTARLTGQRTVEASDIVARTIEEAIRPIREQR